MKSFIVVQSPKDRCRQGLSILILIVEAPTKADAVRNFNKLIDAAPADYSKPVAFDIAERTLRDYQLEAEHTVFPKAIYA